MSYIQPEINMAQIFAWCPIKHHFSLVSIVGMGDGTLK